MEHRYFLADPSIEEYPRRVELTDGIVLTGMKSAFYCP
jgi:hypothetical protein